MKWGDGMKYKIENIDKYEKDLLKVKENIEFLLSLDLTTKELNEEDIEKIYELDKNLWKISRDIWNDRPEIKLVSPNGLELTII